MRNATEVRRELELLLRTRCPAVGLATWEELRALKLVRDVARLLSPSRDLFTWSAGQGLRLEGQAVLGLPIPCSILEAFAAAQEHKGPAIFAFLDADLTDTEVARRIRDLVSATATQPRSLIFIAPHFQLHPTLVRVVPRLNVPLPDRAELKNILSSVAARCSSVVGVEVQLEGDASDRLAEAARGLTSEEAERAYIRALLQAQRLSGREVGIVQGEKKRLLEGDPLLRYVQPMDSLEELGGLEVLKGWFKRRSRAFSEAAVAAGVAPPRGILLVGMPGCGRGHAIRAAARAWELPLLQLELSRLIDSGIDGELELGRALERIEAFAPCVLWIHDLDRVFSRGSETDGGRAETPVAATLQAWLLEKDTPVFVAATAEDHERLPLELLWKRAFDEVFFIDFPTSEERRSILQIQLSRRGLVDADINLEMLVAASEGFSSAQIEQAVVRGICEAFDVDRPIRMTDILQSFRQMTPMAGFMGEPRRRLRGWAHRRAVPASVVKEGA